ncbi:MAG: hypothetical protein LUF84_07935 [Clostridiales bacterium]|nr:hypothetical protein [Clostridiales bacterium]
MAEKELRRMNRTELIEIIYALQQNEKSLREQNEALQRQLDDRLLRLEQAGSIAEASLSLNHIFEDAQQAAAQYLSSLELANDQAQQRLAQADARLAEAQERADQIEADCQARLERADAAAEARLAQAEADYQARMAQAEEFAQQKDAAFRRSVRRALEKYPGLAWHMWEDVWEQRLEP